jgi:hypothetical protein
MSRNNPSRLTNDERRLLQVFLFGHITLAELKEKVSADRWSVFKSQPVMMKRKDVKQDR